MLSQTEGNLKQHIAHTRSPEKHIHIIMKDRADVSVSYVNIEATESIGKGKSKPDDLPQHLREYESKMLRQLEEEEQKYDEDYEDDAGENDEDNNYNQTTQCHD